MLKKTAIILTALAIVFTLAAGPALAAGNIKVGGLRVYPYLTFEETYDSNIYLLSDQEVDSWISRLKPELLLALPMDDFNLEVGGWVKWNWYHGDEQVILSRGTATSSGVILPGTPIVLDPSDQDSTDWGISGSFEGAFPGGLSFLVRDAYSQKWLVATQEFGPGEDLKLNELRGNLGFDIADRFRVDLDYYNNNFDFELNVERDRVENIFAATLYWHFKPKTSLLLEVDYGDFNYDNLDFQGFDRSNYAVQIFGGVTWRVTGKSTGEFKGGYQVKRYDDDTFQPDGEYGVVEGIARHYFTSRTNIQLALSRGTVEAYSFENPYYVSNRLYGELNQKFTAKLYGRVSAEYMDHDYPNDTTVLGVTKSRNDDIVALGLAAGFDIRRWLNLELRYDYEDRNSNFFIYEYSVNQFTFAARGAF